MMKDKKPLFYFKLIFLSIISILGFFVCYQFNKIGIPYWKSLSVLCIVIAGFLIYLKISQFDWYKEETDSIYKKYKGVCNSYQHHVLKNNQLYNLFVNDYCNSNVILSVQRNKDGTISSEDYNLKNTIYHQIKGLLENRYDLVEKYFNKDTFKYKDYLELVREYNTTNIAKEDTLLENITKLQISDHIEEKLAKVKAEIIKYESGEKQPKHIGQRMFGYLLKANYLNAYNDEQRYEVWKEFTGLEQQPEKSFLRDPDYNKNETAKINQQLKQIEEFFYLIGLDIPITYHEKEKKKL